MKVSNITESRTSVTNCIPAPELQINAKQNTTFLPRIFKSMPSTTLHSCPGSSNKREEEHCIPALDLQINTKQNTTFLPRNFKISAKQNTTFRPRIYKSIPRRTLHSSHGSSNQCQAEHYVFPSDLQVSTEQNTAFLPPVLQFIIPELWALNIYYFIVFATKSQRQPAQIQFLTTKSSE